MMRRRNLLFAVGFTAVASRISNAADAMTRVLVVGDSQAQGLAGRAHFKPGTGTYTNLRPGNNP